YPDPRLQQVAAPVERVDDAIRELVGDMAQTMYEAPGIGLAATQIDVHLRVIVIDLSEKRDALQVFINPEILNTGGEVTVHEEGCLSVPGIFENVERPGTITVRALNERGEAFSIEAEGLLAVCLQHEIDHLNGRVFVQHLSRLKQTRIRAKLAKQERDAA
ncbi:MAG: peptide deformylase, partial [Betaproteobacteria bacterium]|nr:peptide deformylase [Betaproteobacteria bacterium]